VNLRVGKALPDASADDAQLILPLLVWPEECPIRVWWMSGYDVKGPGGCLMQLVASDPVAIRIEVLRV
jgi:hypothetical protein